MNLTTLWSHICLPAGASSNHSVPICRNHSDLVKFSSHNSEYDRVVYIIKQMQISTSQRLQERESQISRVVWETQNGNSFSSQQRGVTGETQAHNPTKRTADDVLSPALGKRPRPASHLPENGQPQAGDDLASRDPGPHENMKTLQWELISRLYFSKIDERLTHLEPAQRSTCRWFLTESAYQSWQDVAQQSEHGGFLWIKGNPGTGKSTLMKHLFEQTKVNSRNDRSRITLSFFFLARGTTEEKTTTGLYRSLLHQLFEIAPDLKGSLDWMTRDGARTIQRKGWSEEALKQTLKYAVPKLGNRSLTIFVDALDECDQDKVHDMVSLLEELCDCAAEERTQLQICFSSRYYPDVVINKGIEVCLEEKNGHTEDIREYVRSRLRHKSTSQHFEALRSEILEKSSGIFLWVVLALDILNNEKNISIQKLRERLQEIPPKLNDLFQMILTRDGDNLEQLQLCLKWILFASRALRPQELYFAIQLGCDKECSGFWDQADLDLDGMKDFVRSSSKGLAEVTRNKATEIQFIHESVRDFLLGKYGNQWSGTSENLEGHGHRVLRDCCLTQLNASISHQIEIPDPSPWVSEKQAARLRDPTSLTFPFLKYSVHNVLHHSNLAQRMGIEQEHFLSDFPLQRWIHLNNILELYGNRRYTDSASLLYILGEKDLADLIRIHPRRKFCFKIEAERCGAPILAALAHKSHEAVREFLRAQAENEPPASPLHRLCEQYEHHRRGTKRFGRDFTLRERSAYRLLFDLINNDEEVVALVFILSPHGRGEPSDSSDSTDSTLLPLAISRGHETLVNHLLQRSVHVDQKSEWLDSLLLKASNQESTAIVNLLLDRGADVRTSQGREKPLSNAFSNGSMAVVKLLLDKGANIDSKNTNGETLLLSAAKVGRSAGLRYLLEQGAEIDARDNKGRTPLSWAVGNSTGGTEIAGLLLGEGADIDSGDLDDRTPLSWAAGNFDHGEGNAHLLLEKGADIEAKDKNGRTPLSWAAGESSYDTGITKLLLEKGADIESRDLDDRTPLSWAAGNCRFEAVHLLLENGANIDSKDKDGRTPLWWALSSKYPDTAQLGITMLREAGANIDIVGEAEGGPMSKATSDVAQKTNPEYRPVSAPVD